MYGCQVMYGAFMSISAAYVYSQQILPVFHSLPGLSLNEVSVSSTNEANEYLR